TPHIAVRGSPSDPRHSRRVQPEYGLRGVESDSSRSVRHPYPAEPSSTVRRQPSRIIMCAARVEVYSDQVVALLQGVGTRKGRASYALRNFDAQLDVFGNRT